MRTLAVLLAMLTLNLTACEAPPTSGPMVLPAAAPALTTANPPIDTAPQTAATSTMPPVPVPARTHHLAEVAQGLGGLSEAAYDTLQDKWVGTTEAACNYFVTTALCQDSLCVSGVPDVLAAEYGTYLLGQGWAEVSFQTMKEMLTVGANFDAILQRDGTGSTPGHVSIPIGIATDGNVIVAEGELDSVTHEIKEEPDSYFLTYEGGMHAYINQ